MRGLVAGLLLCLAGLPVQAQEQVRAQDRAARIVAAFEAWMNDAGVTVGTIAISRKGQIIATYGRGTDPDTPMEMASLSKAITGVCLRRLVADGVLSFDDRLGAHLPDAPPLLQDLTLAELVTHTSGLDHDSTQGAMTGWLGDPAPRHGDVAATLFDRNRISGRGSYRYNNENYALLGEVIARRTGRPYRQVCGPEVPGGAVSAQAGAFDAWGGWKMTVAEYAAFHARAFPAGADPSFEPSADLGGGAFYGLGTLWREFQGAHNYWHFGALCFETSGSGAYAVSWKGEWGVVAAWQNCVEFPVARGLDGFLVAAVFGP